MSEIKALVHDVFGTVVDCARQSPPTARRWVRARASPASTGGQFADDWRGAYAPSMNRVRHR